MVWDVRSNQYDSLLPFGDHQWFANPANESALSKWLLPLRHRAIETAPEPNEEDRRRLALLIWHADRLGVSRQSVLNVYDANPSADLPYHGAAHGVTVALRAVEAAIEAGLSDADQADLLLAGIHHDLSYVVGVGESVNITRAIISSGAFIRDPGQATRVAALIRSTQFPHVTPRSESEAILQDADLLQCLEPDRDRWLAALEEETGRPSAPDFPGIDALNTERARERYERRSR